MKRILILAGAPFGWLDRSAREVADAIASIGDANDVITVGAMELAAGHWSPRNAGGAMSRSVCLKDGTRIDAAEIGAVLNLARCLPMTGLARAVPTTAVPRAGGLDAAGGLMTGGLITQPGDREQRDPFVDFLRGFNCRVINSVDSQGPRGLASADKWATLAHRCGIDTDPDGVTVGNRLLSQRVAPPRPTDGASSLPVIDVTVVGERAFGAQSPMHARQCRRLARAAGCELLRLTFAGESPRRLVSADPFPPLAGDIAKAVARLLCDRANAASDRVA